MGVSYLGVLFNKDPTIRVLYFGPLFSETPIWPKAYEAPAHRDG